MRTPRTYIRFCVLLFIGFLSSCTTYIYQGHIQALDSSQTEREVMVTWSVTKKGFFAREGDSILLLTACGTPITFTEQPDNRGIIFYAAPGTVIPSRPELVQTNKVTCGEILDYKKVEDIPPGKLRVMVFCTPKPGRFSGAANRYLKASNDPYVFTVTESKEWSVLGKDVILPKPACQQ